MNDQVFDDDGLRILTVALRHYLLVAEEDLFFPAESPSYYPLKIDSRKHTKRSVKEQNYK